MYQAFWWTWSVQVSFLSAYYYVTKLLMTMIIIYFFLFLCLTLDSCFMIWCRVFEHHSYNVYKTFFMKELGLCQGENEVEEIPDTYETDMLETEECKRARAFLTHLHVWNCQTNLHFHCILTWNDYKYFSFKFYNSRHVKFWVIFCTIESFHLYWSYSAMDGPPIKRRWWGTWRLCLHITIPYHP